MRWIAPLVFIVAAAYVWRHNAETYDSFLVVPGVGLLLPEAEAVKQGELSVRLLSGFGGLLLAFEVWRTARSGAWFEE